jgi:hypothetical protein
MYGDWQNEQILFLRFDVIAGEFRFNITVFFDV